MPHTVHQKSENEFQDIELGPIGPSAGSEAGSKTRPGVQTPKDILTAVRDIDAHHKASKPPPQRVRRMKTWIRGHKVWAAIVVCGMICLFVIMPVFVFFAWPNSKLQKWHG